MTVVYVLLGFAAFVLVVAKASEVLASSRRHVRKIRRRDLNSASEAINRIDLIVSKYYPMSDLVGQAMGDEIRTAIHEHRKVITAR